MLTAERLAQPPDPLRGSVLTSPHPLTPSSLPTPPRRISLLHAVPAPSLGGASLLELTPSPKLPLLASSTVTWNCLISCLPGLKSPWRKTGTRNQSYTQCQVPGRCPRAHFPSTRSRPAPQNQRPSRDGARSMYQTVAERATLSPRRHSGWRPCHGLTRAPQPLPWRPAPAQL